MVVLSVTLGFMQEARADAAAAQLKAMIHVTATVVRGGQATEMPLRDLVPGDIKKLSAGDMIPGDVRLLSAKDLFVSQRSLTGESLPVKKFYDLEPDAAKSPTEIKNTCFMGTSVQSGTARTFVWINAPAGDVLAYACADSTLLRRPHAVDKSVVAAEELDVNEGLM